MNRPTVSVPKESLELVLTHCKMPKDLSFHKARCTNRPTLETEGYVPTLFDDETFTASEKIHAWIAEKEAEGYTVQFSVGKVSCTERLSAYWWASKPSRFGTSSGGCIDLSGKPFTFA